MINLQLENAMCKIRLWLLLVILLSVVCLVQAYGAVEASVPLETGEYCLSASSDGDGGFFLHATNGVFHWKKNKLEGSGETITNDIADISRIAYGNDTLYGLSWNGELVEFREGWQPLWSWHEGEDEITYHAVKAEVFGDKLYFTCTFTEAYEANEKAFFIAYDLVTGAWETLDYPLLGWFAFDEEGALLTLLQKEDGTYLISERLVTGKREPLKEVKLEVTFRYLRKVAYDKTLGRLYVALSNQIGFCDKMGAFTLIADFAHPGEIVPLAGGKIAVLSGYSLFLCVDEYQPGKMLTLMAYPSRHDNAFMADHGVSVKYVDSRYGDPGQDIAQALAAKDGQVDIYGFSSRDGLDAIIEKGMYVDLNENPVLAQMKHEIYDSLLPPLLGSDGQLAAWPVRILPSLWGEDTALLEQYGLGSPETFEELLNVVDEIVDRGILEETAYMFFDPVNYSQQGMLEFFTAQYMYACQMENRPMNFSDAEYRAIAERIMAEFPREPEYRGEPDEIGDVNVFFYGDYYAEYPSEGMRAPFKLSENKAGAILTIMDVLVVNPYSQNRDLAMDYIAYLAQSRDYRDYYIYKTLTEPVEDPQVMEEIASLEARLAQTKAAEVPPEDEKKKASQIAAIESRIAQLSPWKYLISEKAIAEYQQQAPYLYPISSADRIDEKWLRESIAQLVEGRFTLDQFIDHCNQYMALLYAERGLFGE